MSWQYRFHSRKEFTMRPLEFVLDERERKDRRGVTHKRRLPMSAAADYILRQYISQCGTSRSNFTGAVVLRIDYGMALSKTDSARKVGGMDMRKPRADQIAAVVIDALTSDVEAGKSGAWKDSGQVMEVCVSRLPCREFGKGNYLHITIDYYDVVESFTR